MKKKHVKPQQDKPGEIKSVEGRITNLTSLTMMEKTHKSWLKLNDEKVKIRYNKVTGEQI